MVSVLNTAKQENAGNTGTGIFDDSIYSMLFTPTFILFA